MSTPAAALGLSVVMVTPGVYETCRTTIGYLRGQTVRHLIELVVVAPSLAGLQPDEAELACFGAHQLLEVGEIGSTGPAFAAGVLAARAPLVAYGEEHSYPEPGWADALIRAHRGPHAAVGCAIGNANPGLASWAHLYGEFGPAVAPVRSGPASLLGGHHAAYKRSVLLEYGDLLGELLGNECALHLDLRRRGQSLWIEGGAVSNHVNISRPAKFWWLDFMGQRGFAAARSRAGEWSALRRAAYVAATPLVPAVRLRRILRDIRRTGRGRELLPRILAVIVPALCLGAVGEALGYLVGAGRTDLKRLPFELDRYSFVRARDRRSPEQEPELPTPR